MIETNSPTHQMPGDRILYGTAIWVITSVDLSPGGLTLIRPRTWKEWWHDLTTDGKPSKLWINQQTFKWMV